MSPYFPEDVSLHSEYKPKIEIPATQEPPYTQTTVDGANVHTRQKPRGQKWGQDVFNSILFGVADQIGHVANAITNCPTIHVNILELLAAVETIRGIE